MSSLSGSVRSGARFGGGVVSYPSNLLYEEVAFIAFHFHWTREEILNLDHQERQRWVGEINKINQQVNHTGNGTIQLMSHKIVGAN